MTKTILILGAGKSAFNLISYLSYNSQKLKIKIKLISDKTPEYINEIKKIQFLTIDINDKCKFTTQQLMDADEVWITSSTREIVPITSIDGSQISNGRAGPIWSIVYDEYQSLKS